MTTFDSSTPITWKHVPWLMAWLVIGVIEGVVDYIIGMNTLIWLGFVPRWCQCPVTFSVLERGFGITYELIMDKVRIKEELRCRSF